MSKHTPGPWKINHWESFSNPEDSGVYFDGIKHGISYFYAKILEPNYFRIVGDKKLLSTSHTWGDHQGAHICKISIAPSDNGQEEAEANARLIAAAPELLDMLIELLAFPNNEPIREKARKIIAVAEGKE